MSQALLAREGLTATLEGGVLDVVLHRGAANEIGLSLLSDLEALVALFGDARVRVLLMHSASRRGFSAGADLRELHEGNVRRRAEGASDAARVAEVRAFLDRIHAVMDAIDAAPFPTIAATHGVVFGGGFELALACDVRVVADEARLGLPEARLGLLPAAGGTQRMTRICGESVARRLILGAEVVQGADAVGLGLAQWRAPAAELRATACGIVERIADLPGAALRESKRCIAAALDSRRDGYEVELEGSGALLALEETQERVRRFLDRDAS